MAQKKYTEPRLDELAPAPAPADPESVASQFILREEAKPQYVKRELSPQEQERRDLQRRFKKLRGFKPTTKDMEELRQLVKTVELAAWRID